MTTTTTKTPARKISPRAQRVWQRLIGYYGARKITEELGDIPSEDWCSLIDASDHKSIDRAMEVCRTQHRIWPPTLGQFEDALKPPATPKQEQGPTLIDRLEAFSRQQHRLTMMQERKRRWLYSGRGWAPDSKIVGVEYPPDGDVPGYRVMVQDMEALGVSACA